MENNEVKTENSKKNIGLIIGICAAVVAVIVAIVIVVNVVNGPKKYKTKLENELKEIGKDFYENFYYDIVVNNNGVEQISKFNSVGIKVNLDNLQRYKNENADKIKDFVNPKTKEECNKEETKVIIYPQDPYGKENYTMEVQLSCGFDEK